MKKKATPEENTRADRIAEAAEELQGYCLRTAEEHFEAYGLDYDTFTMAELGIVDEIVFMCDCCGWWCEADTSEEIYGELLCWRCAQDIEGEEEEDE